jgi:uncharacterized membrane-anchored protein|tara:strand:- start:156 stop:374 length:219 start_codon:yes stop_codon:yes gene_type:complete
MNTAIGNWLLFIGTLLFIVGIVVKLGFFSWIGNLPGDIHIKREGFQFYFPLMSMIVVSIVLSSIVAVIKKLF